MTNRNAVPKSIAYCLTAVGSGLGGFGIYGLLLYHLEIETGVSAFGLGLALVVTGLVLGRSKGSNSHS